MVEISSFDPPKKSKERHFFQVTQLLLWNAGFMIDVLGSCIKKWYVLPGKIVHQKQLPPGVHFLLWPAPASHKNFKRNQLKRQMFTNQLLYKSVFRFFLIQIIARWTLIYFLHHIFRFWLEQKKLHKKLIKTEHLFVEKVFDYDLTKFEKDWRK